MHRVLFVLGSLLLASGFGLLFTAQVPPPESIQGIDTFRIPVGAGWHSFFELDMIAGGTVAVEFQETTAGAVTVYLFTQEDYAAYNDSGWAGLYLGRLHGPAGAFSVEIPQDGTYFLVFEHGLGFEGAPQDVKLTYFIAGLTPLGPDRDLTRIGFALILLGAVAGNVGGFLVIRRRAAREKRGSTEPMDLRAPNRP